MLRKLVWIPWCLPLLAPLSTRAQVVRGPEVRSTEEYGLVFYDPRHDPWEMPDRIVETMNIKNSDNVAEIGYGVGYFSRRFAKFAQRAFAIDKDPTALAHALFEAPDNLTVTANFPPGQLLDKVFLHNTLDKIPDRVSYFLAVGQALRKNGQIFVVDFFKNLPPGLPPAGRITAATVTAEMKQAGFQLVQSYDFLPYQYFLVFSR